MAALPLPAPADDWRDRAACKDTDTETFFTFTPGPGGTHEAKAICGWCPVRDACLHYALDMESASGHGWVGRYGIWGGLTPQERKALARDRPETCRRCSTPIDRKRGSNTLYCPPCRDTRRRETQERHNYRADQRTRTETPASPTRRVRLESRADGNTGTAITSHGHVPLPGEGT